MKKVAFHNLGCKVNSYELDGICQDFQKADFEIVDFAEEADVYIINTCSVTNIADRKSRQMIHRARKQKPDSVVVAIGCLVQAEPEKVKEENDIDIVIGNNLKSKTFDIVMEYLKEHKNLAAVNKPDVNNPDTADVNTHVLDLTKETEYEDIHIENSNEHTRAFIKIQDGCNQFCSYCIIPYVRGRIRSRDIRFVLDEVKRLVAAGYTEVVLTGIHLSSYGITDTSYNEKAKEGFTNEALLDVIDAVAEIEGIRRIRLGSLEPRLITKDFLRRLSANKKVCPHFHLSLQSGCDSVLKRMNRHYSSDEFCEVVELIRNYYEHPAITTDVIVGFPGESEEEFKVTEEFLDRINLYEVHLFKYSRRKGTVADKMPGQLTDKIKSVRSGILSEKDKIRRRDFAGYYIGRNVEILLEDLEKIDGEDYMVGYTPEYVKCAVKLSGDMTEEKAEGRIIPVKGISLATEGAVLKCDIL